MYAQKRNKSLMLFLSISAVLAPISLILQTKPALAGCGFLDITCDPSKWDSPFPKSSPSDSCTQSVVTPMYRKFSITNRTKNIISFKSGNKKFSLEPGAASSYKTQITSGSSDGCGSTFLGDPAVTFDSDYSSGYQKASYTIAHDGTYYFINKTGSIISFLRAGKG
jgi:hypothetical protein